MSTRDDLRERLLKIASKEVMARDGATFRERLMDGYEVAYTQGLRDAAAALDEEPPLESEKVARLRAQIGRLQHAIHVHNRDHLRVTLQLDDMGQLPPLDVPPIAEERNGLLFGDLAPLERQEDDNA